MGATVIFAPAPIDGYKPRVFVQRQDPGIKGGVTEHLAAAEQQVNQKKYDGFELITKGMKIESGIDYGELVYRYQPKNLPVTLTNSMCVLSLAPDRWITFQTSSATTAQEKIAEDFALIRQGIFATGGSK